MMITIVIAVYPKKIQQMCQKFNQSLFSEPVWS